MKRLLLGLPLLLLAAPVRAEALTWKEFWEPFVESYHYGHDHGSGHWEDWRYDHGHGHYHPRPRRPKCEYIITTKTWIPGHYFPNSNVWSPGYYETRDHIKYRPCRRLRPL